MQPNGAQSGEIQAPSENAQRGRGHDGGFDVSVRSVQLQDEEEGAHEATQDEPLRGPAAPVWHVRHDIQEERHAQSTQAGSSGKGTEEAEVCVSGLWQGLQIQGKSIVKEWGQRLNFSYQGWGIPFGGLAWESSINILKISVRSKVYNQFLRMIYWG